MFEGAAGPPDYLALSFPFSRERHRDLMLRFRQLSQFGVMVSDRSRGSVRERAGRPVIRYDLEPRGRGRLQARHRAADRALLGGRGAGRLPAGRGHARSCATATLGPLPAGELRAARPDADGLPPARHRPRRRAPDARRGRRATCACTASRALYVSDASAVPELARRQPADHDHGAGHAAGLSTCSGRPAPDDEPEPESIARPRVARARLSARAALSTPQRARDQAVHHAIGHDLRQRRRAAWRRGRRGSACAGLLRGQRLADRLGDHLRLDAGLVLRCPSIAARTPSISVP